MYVFVYIYVYVCICIYACKYYVNTHRSTRARTTIWKVITPSAHRSAAKEQGRSCRTSGDTYSSVPTKEERWAAEAALPSPFSVCQQSKIDNIQ